MRKYFRIAGRIALVTACLTYVLWDIEFKAVGRALSQFDPVGTLLMGLMMWVSFVATAVRLRFISDRKVGFIEGFNAGVLGLGLSNILPAKGGELAKVLYIRRESRISLSRSFAIVFWERFFDLNAACVLGLAAALFMGQAMLAVSLGAATAVIWVVLAAAKRWPQMASQMSRFLYFARLKAFFTETVAQTAEGMRIKYLLGIAFFTIPMWLSYYFEYHFLLFDAADFNLSLGAGLSVFILGALGLAAPTSPGGLGVYEAVIVAALGMFGIDKERAVAAGLVFRFFQYVPITLYALGILAKKGLPIRKMGEEDDESESDISDTLDTRRAV